MKKALLYSASVLMLAAMACNKTDNVAIEGDGLIRFAPVAEDTRALVYQSTLSGETFWVYDFKDGEKYIDNQIKYGTDGWVYVDEVDYLWKNTSHKLFGYSKDFGPLPENQKISYSKVLTTSPATQVDMLYSATVNTTAEAWKHTAGNTKETPVKLNLKHLLSAVSIAVKNGKGSQIVLNTVTVPSISNSGSATVDYSGESVAITYTDPVVGETPFVSGAALKDVPVSAGGLVDILTQALGNPTPYMVWPQTIPAMDIVVKYTKDGSVYEATASIPPVKWDAGKLYNYTLIIGEADDILLNFTVKDWIDGGSEEKYFE